MATRRERVVLELQDDFTGDMLRAAAATEVLNRELKKLSGSTGRNTSLTRMSRDAAAAERDVSTLGRTSQRAGNQIDTLSGRVSVFASAMATLGPGLIPIAAVGVPAVAGLAAQFGFAAAGAGVLIGSMQGVGTALKAVDKAALQPTTENLAAAKLAMQQISPAAQGFVRELQHMEPELKKLRDTGATNMFPGFTEGLTSLERVFPRVQNIVGSIASELGNIGSEAGASLASDRWAPFLDFIAREAPAALHDLAAIAGNTGHAMAELWMAFTPTNRQFSSFLVSASQDLDRWASGLSKTAGFQEFISYVQANGPQVGATLAAVANAFLQIVEAAAPLGGPVLHIVEALANAVAALANSDLGTPIFGAIAAWRAYAVAASLAEKAQMKFNASSAGGFGMVGLKTKTSSTKSFAAQTKKDLGVVATTWATAGAKSERESTRMSESSKRLTTSLKGVGRGAAGIAALGVASSGLADGVGLANTASMALLGTMAEPGLGTAVGALVGGFLDLKAAGEPLASTLDRLNASAAAGQWDAVAAGIASVTAQVDDLKQHTGVKDTIGDYFKTASGALHGNLSFGLTGPKLSSSAQKKVNAAQAVQDNALRTKGATAANAAMAASSELAAHGFNLTAAGARNAGMSIAGFTASVAGANAVLARQGTLDAYRTSLLDAADAIKQNGRTLATNTRAGLANRAMLRQLATGAVEYGTKMKDAAKRTEFMDKARSDFIGVAKAMNASGAEARHMADRFGLVDQGAKGAAAGVKELQAKINALKSKIVDAKAKGAKESSPQVQALRDQIAKLKGKIVDTGEKGSAAARARIQALQAQINALHGTTITNTIVTQHVGNPGGPLGVKKQADGGTVMGQRYPYGDKVHTMLAPGEEVITNRHGEADRFRADRASGRIPHYADGGTVQKLAAGGQVAYAAGRGITVSFPAPSVLSQAVAAANAIAVSTANTARSAAEIRQTHLDDLHQQQQIRDLQKSLTERDKRTVGTGKNRHQVQGAFTLKGLDRATAQAELADAKAQLGALRSITDAGKQAIDSLAQARDDARSQLAGGIDLFAGSAGSAVRNVDRYVADISTAGQVMAQLRAKGASPLLLQQMQQHVLQGDARAAVRLGQAFLAQPALLGQLNSSLSTLGSVSANVAALTTDPRFAQSGKWDPTGQATSTKVVRIELSTDPSTWTTDITRRAVAEVTAAMNGGG